MRAIKLTEKQQDKLLKMCEKLFSEYSITINSKTIPNILCITRANPYSVEYIHWFEFCMTHLVNKLYYPDNIGKRNTRELVEYFFFQSFVDTIEGATSGYNHPIDYLHEHFLKLPK